jgi:ubiquinone biosynthesis protein Coq4
MWLYKEKEIKELTDIPENTFGFIYVVTHTPTGRKY